LVGYVHNPTRQHDKLGPRATKMVLIGYYEHSKRYVTYGELPNGGMTEVDPTMLIFLWMSF